MVLLVFVYNLPQLFPVTQHRQQPAAVDLRHIGRFGDGHRHQPGDKRHPEQRWPKGKARRAMR
jgi:hypothetical protein